MSQPTPSATGGAASIAGDLPLDQRPERPNPSIDEKKGKGACTLTYEYPSEKTDQVRWSIKDTQDGNVYIRFEVQRQGSDRLAYLHKSRPVPATLNLRENLVHSKLNTPGVITKKGFKLELIKQENFELEPFFRPPSPSSSLP
ncbi:hypothetical protein ACOMHN_061102 [Nucella lapillus]